MITIVEMRKKCKHHSDIIMLIEYLLEMDMKLKAKTPAKSSSYVKMNSSFILSSLPLTDINTNTRTHMQIYLLTYLRTRWLIHSLTHTME